MKKSIIHITTVHYRYDVRVNYKYCQSLSKAYNDVTLLVADGNGFEKIGNLQIVDIGKPKFGRIGRLFFGNIKVFIYLIRCQTSIIHFHDPELLPIAFLMKLLGRKVVYDMHENLPLEILTKNYVPRVFRKFLSFAINNFQQFTFRYVPVIFAEISYVKYFPLASHKETILNYPLNNIANNKLIINKEKEFTLGYMGGVTVERGAIVILKAVEKLREDGIAVNLIFVGPVAEEVSESLIYNKATKEGWATFEGRLKPIDGWEKMSRCHVGLAILQDSPNFIESYPTKLFEYMLMGLPIITSNFPLYKEVIDESKCGATVNPSSIKEIASTISWLFDNRNEAVKIGERGRKIAEKKYSWESEFSKLETFYYNILEK